MLKKIRDFSKNQKGSFSIIVVILVFIVAMVITGFVDILHKTYNLGEIQSIMDTSGNSALHAGLDTTELRVENFKDNSSYIENDYRNKVASLIHTNENITAFDMVSVNIKGYDDTWGLGSASSGDRPYVILDSVARVQVSQSQLFDLIPKATQTFYNSRSNGNFTIIYEGMTKDGHAELVIRSVSRLVYR